MANNTQAIGHQLNDQFGIPEHISEALDKLLDYLWEDEQRHFTFCKDSGQEAGHIFEVLQCIRSWIDNELKRRGPDDANR